MSNELYRTYEVLVEESVHEDHPKRAKTTKESRFDQEIDGALRDTHMIFQDAVCYNTLCFAGLAGNEPPPGGERGRDFLNPLWKHLTTPRSKGGIKDETERVIRRLATHYAPLKDLDKEGVTAEDFVNLVYSKPLRTRADMKPEERQAVLNLRAKCYRILEMFGAPVKENGKQECADMKEFKNDWAGQMSDPASDAEIPGNGTYDRFWRELRQSIKADDDEEQTAHIIDATLKKYAVESERVNQADCERDYLAELQKHKDALAAVEALPDSDKKKPAKVNRARASLELFEKEKAHYAQAFFDNRRESLATAVGKAFSKHFAAKAGSELGLTDTEFAAAGIRAVEVGAGAKANTSAHVRLHYKGGRTGSFENAMFRYCVLRTDTDPLVRRAALLDFRRFILENEPKEEPSIDGQWVKEMPFIAAGADFAFRYFGKECLGIPTGGSSPDSEFDKIAFVTAAEDVFKYKIRSNERAKKVAERVSVVRAFEGNNSLGANENATGRKVAGMKDDPRWKCDEANRKGIVQLLKGLSGDKEIVSYGLREGTIGGWAEVRKRFLAIHAAARKRGTPMDDPSLVTELETAVDEEMNANRQGFGSADFFHALCAPEYHHLWLDSADYVRNGIRDFIPHYVQYSEAREELMRLLKSEDGTEMAWDDELSEAKAKGLVTMPIRHTWPGLLNRHKKPSYRYYDFTAKLDPKFPMQLFRRVRPEDDPTRVDCYKLIPAKDAVLTLAARRLKRDKILNKNAETGEWTSVDALWCPPLILEGEKSPTPETKPIAKKKKQKATDKAEVSFSLIAAPLPGDYWSTVAGVPSATEKEPVHLTASFKIEGDETAKLRADTHQWTSGSLRGAGKKGEQDDKRRHFKWQIDLETSKFDSENADEKPKELWCGKGKASDEWRGFTFRHDGKKTTYQVPDFHILSIDLGNRFAAAFTRLRIHADSNGDGREISHQHTPLIKAAVFGAPGKLCLQGEGAETWQLVTEKNKPHITQKLKSKGIDKVPVVGSYELVDEPFGNGGRGRFPIDKEYENFLKLAGRLVPLESLPPAGKEQTYPELGDHLVFRLKRRIGRLRTLFNLAWRLRGKNERHQQTGSKGKERGDEEIARHRRNVVETLARSAFPKRPRQTGEAEDPGDKSLRQKLMGDAEWQRLRNAKLLESQKGAAENERLNSLDAALISIPNQNWDALADGVETQIKEHVEGGSDKVLEPPLHELLASVVEFCLPLKGRHWRWENNPEGERLFWEKPGSSPDWNPNMMGMRGLSMKRLEQILNLRQRCQSFAKLEDRYHGVPARAGVLGCKGFKDGIYDPQDSNRDERPDCCPKLLERSNRIREQRVDQTAHLILAEALGMELKSPAEVANKKERKSEVDLHGEYKRRLDKDGKPYPRCSVIVLENLERYRTSQERTRAENSRLMQWAHRAIIEKLEDMCRPFGITIMLVDPAFSSHFDSRTGLPGVRVEEVSSGFEQTYPYKLWKDGKTKKGTKPKLAQDIDDLVALFEANKETYTSTLVLAVEGGKLFCPVLPPARGSEGLINADINAAGNIGLRGVADPQRWDIFPRLRTKQVSDNEVCVRNWRGWFGKFPQETKEEKSENRRMKAHGAETTPVASSANVAEGDNADSESSQSSEYPWFFVEHPQYSRLLGELQDVVYCYKHEDMKFRALPQGIYLKRVESVCAERIKAINESRLRRAQVEQDRDDIKMD